ncbi:MAG: hypothetical protein LBV08_03170 [Clostridiales bacterium]|nr:hypothetical protein [Clostridiales bacterium]
MGLTEILLILVIVVGIVAVVFYYLNRWASKRMVAHEDIIAKSKQTVSIFVIDKKRDRPQNANLPKQVMAQLPKVYKFMKANLVKAKIGPQIHTLMCDKKVYNTIPVKKTIKVDLAGLYIVSVKGVKTEEEVKKIRKEKKEKEKLEKKELAKAEKLKK